MSMMDEAAPKPVVEQRFQKMEEQKFLSYEDARVAFDAAMVNLRKSKTQRARIRRRKDGYSLVIYGPAQKKAGAVVADDANDANDANDTESE